jgi:hypothetical protein
MKKTYQNPITTVGAMFTVDMIASSLGFNETLDETGGDGSDALSRDFYIWDDKDEEVDF